MFVPVGVPHAFANPTRKPTKMFFQSSVPGGHEHYFDDLVALLRRSDGSPDPRDIAELRRRYDIEQLTPLRAGHPEPRAESTTQVDDSPAPGPTAGGEDAAAPGDDPAHGDDHDHPHGDGGDHDHSHEHH